MITDTFMPRKWVLPFIMILNGGYHIFMGNYKNAKQKNKAKEMNAKAHSVKISSNGGLFATCFLFQSRWEQYLPSEEYELTANSLGAHIETHGGLIWGNSVSFTVNSQDDSHCELAVSSPWVCNCHNGLTATTAWWAAQGDLMNSLQQAHGVSCKLTASSQCESSCDVTVR